MGSTPSKPHRLRLRGSPEGNSATVMRRREGKTTGVHAPVASTGDSDMQPGEELWVGGVTGILTWGEKEESSGRTENQAREDGRRWGSGSQGLGW